MKDNRIYESHKNRLLKIKKWGFTIHPDYFVSFDIKKIFEYYTNIYENKSNLNFGIDGIVIKVNNVFLQQKLGFLERYPRWAIAIKFPSFFVETKVLDVFFQIGRTGAITPIAKVFPVKISGVIIKKINLYNFNKIKELKILIGDFVIVYRAGEVIPKIKNVIFSKRSYDTKEIKIPSFCMSCKSQLIFFSNTNMLYCPSSFSCPAQNLRKLIHFSSKNGIYIKGLGPNLIKKLIDFGYLKNPVDFFYITVNQLISISGIKEKMAIKIISSINLSRTISLEKFIFSLGIIGVGQLVSKKISIFCYSLEKFLISDFKTLCLINGIGKSISKSIICFFENKENKEIVLKLKSILNIPPFFLNSVYLNENSKINIYGKKIVFSGKFKFFTRDLLKRTIESFGGYIYKSISKKIDYLICSSNVGNKFEFAKKMNIKILTEDDIKKMIL